MAVSTRLRDYTGIPSVITNLQSHSNLVSGTFPYPLQNFTSFAALTPSYSHFLAATSQTNIPYTFKQAATDSNWLTAMKVELNALENNQTWEIVPKPSDKHIVDCKWLFKIKYLPNGCVERYKAHLVAKDFTQTYGFDYFETFAPVAKMTKVRLLIAISVSKGWSISQLDVTKYFPSWRFK